MTRVVIISDVAPSDALTAGAVLNRFVDALPRSWAVDCVTVGDVSLTYSLRDSNADRIFYIRKPWTNWGSPLPQVFSRKLQRLVQKREVPKLVSRIQTLITQLNPDVIITAAQCPVLVAILRDLETDSKKVFGFMWDHPSWWAETHGVSGAEKTEFLDQWQKNLEHCDVRILPSEGATGLFAHPKSDSESLVLYPNLVDRPSGHRLQLNSTLGAIKIGFAGQLYAAPELNWLIGALDRSNWTVRGRKVELHLFGSHTMVLNRPEIIHHGWLPPVEVGNMLSQMDFAALPYPSAPSMDTVSRTSFPSKLALYLSAGLPVLVLGRNDSSVAQFVNQHGIGIVQGEEFEVDLLEDLILESHEFRSRVQSSYEKFFSRQAFASAVESLFSRHGFDLLDAKSVGLRVRIRSGTWDGQRPRGRAHVLRSTYLPFSLGVGLILQPRRAAQSALAFCSPPDGFKAGLTRAYITLPRLAIGMFFRIFNRERSIQSSPATPRPVPIEEISWLGRGDENA